MLRYRLLVNNPVHRALMRHPPGVECGLDHCHQVSLEGLYQWVVGVVGETPRETFCFYLRRAGRYHGFVFANPLVFGLRVPGSLYIPKQKGGAPPGPNLSLRLAVVRKRLRKKGLSASRDVDYLLPLGGPEGEGREVPDGPGQWPPNRLCLLRAEEVNYCWSLRIRQAGYSAFSSIREIPSDLLWTANRITHEQTNAIFEMAQAGTHFTDWAKSIGVSPGGWIFQAATRPAIHRLDQLAWLLANGKELLEAGERRSSLAEMPPPASSLPSRKPATGEALVAARAQMAHATKAKSRKLDRNRFRTQIS